jgi:hypothetical protein
MGRLGNGLFQCRFSYPFLKLGQRENDKKQQDILCRSRVGYSRSQTNRDREDTRTRDELNCVDPSFSQQRTTNSASQVNLLRKQEVCDRVQKTAAGPDPEPSPRLHLQRPLHQILGHIRFIFTSEIRPLSPHLHFTVLSKFQEVLKCVTLSSIATLRLQSHLNPANAHLNFICV